MSSNHPTRSGRQGISIIEVLTSMIVAMIGVLGIMIMIPFAVQQTETGLDRDAATVVARNAFAQFETRGFRAVRRVDRSGVAVRELNWTEDGENWVSANVPMVYCIDPLGMVENGSPYDASVSFPFNATPALAGNLEIATVNLTNALVPTALRTVPMDSSYPMGVAMARQMFRGQDELSFGDPATTPAFPDADLNAPQQYFDVDATGLVELRRQYQGSLSWCAIVVPVKDDYSTPPVSPTGAWKYRMYVLVFKDRPTLLDPVGDGVMFTAALDAGANVGLASPLSTVYLTTGVQVEDTKIYKDDWVMLINRDGAATAETGFERQIAFARVINFANGNGVVLPSLTLDGPDFEFASPSNPGIEDTYIVHLRNVVGVYERTFVLEGESNWNISF